MEERQKHIQKLLTRAYQYLGLRLRTEKEIREYVSQKAEIYEYGQDIVPDVVEHLKEQGYVDDQKFIEAYVSSRQSRKQKGTTILKNELRQKGIHEDHLEEFFQKNPQNEDVLAKEVLEKIAHKYSRFDRLERQKKIYAYLYRRGFSYDTIRKTIEEFDKKG